jgi:[protein-PII] uridylyltransferase
LLQGKGRLKALLERRRPAERRVEAFDVEPEVIINNKLSDKFTVIEVSGLDRTGLLYDLTTALSDLYLDISSAHITTFGEKAVDVFYVTDLTHKQIESESRQDSIRERLVEVLAQDRDDDGLSRKAG